MTADETIELKALTKVRDDLVKLREKAHDKLDNLLNTNWTGDTSTSIYIKILNNYLSSLNTEIYEMTKSEVNNNDNT